MNNEEITFKLPNELYDILTEENIQEITDGIAVTLKFYLAFVANIREVRNDYTSKNTELTRPAEMVWKNDGKKEYNIQIMGVK